MAQTMLAALTSSRSGASAASILAGAPRNQVQSVGRHLAGSRPAVGEAVTEELQGSSSKMAEVHWEPAVQLPSLQPADNSRHTDIISKAETVPAGQVGATEKLSLFLAATAIQLAAFPVGRAMTRGPLLAYFAATS